MFENLEENKTAQASDSQASQPAPFPPQAKAEDIFAGVKDAGLPRTSSGQAAPEPLKVANRPKGGSGLILKLLIIILVILILSIAGLVVASQYFGFTGLKDVLSGNKTEDVVIPVKKNDSANDVGNVKDDPAAVEEKKGGVPSGMPGLEDEPATSSTPAVPADTAKPTSTVPVTTPATTSPAAATTTPVIVDTDADTLSDSQELSLGTDPKKMDTDNDGLSDSQEVNLSSSPLKVDSDNDGLSDYEEVSKYMTDPNKPDTDADGYLDGAEVKGGYNPKGPGKLTSPVK